MDLFKTRLITILIAFGLITTALVGAGLYYLIPTFDWNWFVGIAAFFLILEPILISYVVGVSSKEKKKLVNAYMLTKVVKVIFALFFVTIYALVVKENIKSFVAVFILFYLLYLIVEAYLFIKIEKHIKENKSNEK